MADSGKEKKWYRSISLRKQKDRDKPRKDPPDVTQVPSTQPQGGGWSAFIENSPEATVGELFPDDLQRVKNAAEDEVKRKPLDKHSPQSQLEQIELQLQEKEKEFHQESENKSLTERLYALLDCYEKRIESERTEVSKGHEKIRRGMVKDMKELETRMSEAEKTHNEALTKIKDKSQALEVKWREERENMMSELVSLKKKAENADKRHQEEKGKLNSELGELRSNMERLETQMKEKQDELRQVVEQHQQDRQQLQSKSKELEEMKEEVRREKEQLVLEKEKENCKLRDEVAELKNKCHDQQAKITDLESEEKLQEQEAKAEMDLKEKEKELEDLRQQLLTMQEQLQKNDTMRESELKEPKVLKSTADLNNQLENCGEQTCYKKSEAWQEETEKLTTVFENAETEEGHVTQNIDEGYCLAGLVLLAAVIGAIVHPFFKGQYPVQDIESTKTTSDTRIISENWLTMEPTMQLLSLIKYTNIQGQEISFRLINEIQNDCMNLGTQLGIDHATLKSLKSGHESPPEVCKDILQTWINQGDRVTWDGLLQALHDIQLKGIERHLREALNLLSQR